MAQDPTAVQIRVAGNNETLVNQLAEIVINSALFKGLTVKEDAPGRLGRKGDVLRYIYLSQQEATE